MRVIDIDQSTLARLLCPPVVLHGISLLLIWPLLIVRLRLSLICPILAALEGVAAVTTPRRGAPASAAAGRWPVKRREDC